MSIANQKHRVRAAVAIAGRYESRTRDLKIQLPSETWKVCVKRLNTLQVALEKGWSRAATLCQRRLAIDTLHCAEQLELVSAQFPRVLPSHPTCKSIYDELLAMELEFVQIKFDLKSKTVSVLTDVIELDGLYLGAFWIKLNWDNSPDFKMTYQVVADDPHPAAHDSGTTHPHVSNQTLCEGEGSAAIRAALGEGRLFDFCVLVQQILRTYNPESAYVSIDQWEGTRCEDCGEHVSGEYSRDCELCACGLCEGCAFYCGSCEVSCCNTCHESCNDCDEVTCKGCLVECSRCKNSFCKSCLTEGECDACHKENEAEEEESEAKTTGNPVQPVCLGQVVLSS